MSVGGSEGGPEPFLFSNIIRFQSTVPVLVMCLCVRVRECASACARAHLAAQSSKSRALMHLGWVFQRSMVHEIELELGGFSSLSISVVGVFTHPI